MRNRRIIAVALGLVFIVDLLAPSVAWALTSGPSQPEVQGFTPVDASDMVNLFSGDLSYNIPLMDVEGYPLNLSYSGGPGMDQEASWVGLGWSLNPGIVERNLRGLPDDFSGDQVTREITMRPNITVSATGGLGVELFGIDPEGVIDPDAFGANLTTSITPSFNNYDGVQFAIGLNMGMRSAKSGASRFTAGLGLTSSSNAGLTVQPQVGVEVGYEKADRNGLTGGLNFGLGMNSRQGLTGMSFGTSLRSTRSENVAEKGETPKYESRTNWSRNGPGKSFSPGQPTYTPQVSIPMENTSVSLRTTLGSAVVGFHGHVFVGGSYSRQRIRTPRVVQPAFGYLHLGSGQGNERALLDMNREKDGPYMPSHTSLPITSLTNDVFSVSGQNIAGSYRAYRDEVGHVFDATTVSTGSGGSLGLEFGIGAGAHFGMDLNVNSMTTRSGPWSTHNSAGGALRFRTAMDGPSDEHVYFREANEPTFGSDDGLFAAFGADQPMRFAMQDAGSFNVRLSSGLDNGSGSVMPLPPSNERTQREPRGQVFSYLTHREVVNGFGLEAPRPRNGGYFDHTVANPNEIPGHHMSEITVLAANGGRNIYGIPAYNVRQDDVTFAIGNTGAPQDIDVTSVNYVHGTDNSTNNQRGKDRFYSRSTTPPYAYAFLLTAAVSHDYSDVDGIRGPSKNDLGNWTKFSYKLAQAAYPWRTPAGTSTARLDQGRGAVAHDDKANYVYGEKEIWYLSKVESRNMLAIFHTSPRADGCGINENGSVNTLRRQHQLDKIELFERAVYEADPANAVPIKTVHFTYSYDLCQGVPNHASPGAGKLTLKQVHFTYGRSNRGVTSPYVFSYQGNFPYVDTYTDRWGMYMPAESSSDAIMPLPNHAFPYTRQDRDLTDGTSLSDQYAAAWTLSEVKLPSGGWIQIELEADDYAYVQTKRAHRMYRIGHIQRHTYNPSGPNTLEELTPHPASISSAEVDLSDYSNSEQIKFRFYVEVPNGMFDASESSNTLEEQLRQLFDEVNGQLYFRFRMRFDLGASANDFDFVSGYAPIELNDQTWEMVTIGSRTYVPIVVRARKIDEENSELNVLPMYRAALEKARLEYPTELYKPNALGEDDAAIYELIMGVSSAVVGFFTGFAEFFRGPNLKVLDDVDDNFGKVVPAECWVRLSDPTGRKEGGGYRVRQIRTMDVWDAMVIDATVPPRTYGRSYTYTTAENGRTISSGVAAWEPSIGADENVWRRPFFGTVSAPLGNDERFYQEEPFGESLYPAASVGYSKVVVADLYPTGTQYTPQEIMERQGTGRVVNEFYTAKDFPTRSTRTGLRAERRRSNYDVLSLLGMKANDHMHTTQGFVVETNDMHGKPARTTVYGQATSDGPEQVVSYVEYHYARQPGNPSALDNTARVIKPDGTIENGATIGRHFEFYADMREYSSKARSGGMALNTEGILPFILIPIMLFNASSESTIYRSGTLVKRIHRFGLLEKMVKMENGSVVSTENLAYDSESGGVLVTRTRNDFEDPVYTMRFPAFWHYAGTAPAYKNLGAIQELTFNSGLAALSGAPLMPGDELAMWHTTLPDVVVKGWVTQVQPNAVRVVNKYGLAVQNGTYRTKVIRSGARNVIEANMTDLTLLSDPLQGFLGNVYAEVLSAQVVDMEERWRTNCGCFENNVFIATSNPYRLNTRGVWRVNRQHTWLTDRVRSLMNSNTDVRRDGVYASFDPFYELQGGTWVKQPDGWTLVSEVTEYSPRGQELENVDALGIPSSASFGHGGTLAKTVARNAGYREVGFDGFEEGAAPFDCFDGHFRLIGPDNSISDKLAHTGRRSIRVHEANIPVYFEYQVDCDRIGHEALRVEGLNGTYHVLNGVPPYTVEPLSGPATAKVLPTSDGFRLLGSACAVKVKVKDGAGQEWTGTVTCAP